MTIHHRFRRAFTLIELLIVIAIIGLLIGLIIPAVQRVREGANRASCTNNLRQIGMALVNISTTTGSFPGVINDTTKTSPPIQQSWVPFLLPYLDQDNLGRLYNMQETPLSTNNRPLIATVLSVLACPSVDTNHLWTTGTGNTYAVTDYSPCVRVGLGLRGTT